MAGFFELGEYASKVAHGWSGGILPWGHAGDARDPADLYRETLANAEVGTVTIVSIGFLDNVCLSMFYTQTWTTPALLASLQLIYVIGLNLAFRPVELYKGLSFRA